MPSTKAIQQQRILLPNKIKLQNFPVYKSIPKNKQLDRSIHFLHIGKTGGTAIKHVLAPLCQQWPRLQLHAHPTRLQDVPVGQAVFFFLRDPVARFVSGFYSRQRKGQPRYNSSWSTAEAQAFARFDSANALALALSASDPAECNAAHAAMAAIQHVRDSYWYWLGSPDALWQRRHDVLLIGQQEHLADDVRILGQLLGLPLCALPTDPVQAHRHPGPLPPPLQPQARLNLQAWYAADYAALATCRQLAQELRLPGSLARATGATLPGG